MRRYLALLAGALVVAAVLVGASAPADAHALLSASEPGDGATVDIAPQQVLLTFTETPDLALSVIRVLDASGRSVGSGKAEQVTGQPQQLRVRLSSIPQGAYTLTWRVTSAADGHTTVGSFAFGVGVPVVAGTGVSVTAGEAPSPSVASVAGRWLLYGGLLLMVGAAFLGVIVAQRPASIPRLALAAAWALAAAGLGITALDHRATAETSLPRLLDSTTGHKLIVQAIAIAAAGATVAWAAWRRSRLALGAVGVAAAAAMVARAQAGHADASSAPWFAVGAQTLHLLAVGAWVGGLVWLLAALRRTGGDDRRRLVRRFSSLAGIALGVVVLTGVVRSIDEVGAWGRLTSTSFGKALLVKLAFVAGLVALGALSRYRYVRRTTTPTLEALTGLRRTVWGEAAFAAGILGTTALLTGLPPSATVAEVSREPTVPQVEVTGNDYGTSVRVKLSVSPGTAGENVFDATVVDYDTRKTVDADKVTLRFQLADRPDVDSGSLDLVRGEDSHWRAKGTGLSIEGRWGVTAVVQTSSDAFGVPIELVAGPRTQRVEVASAPGQPDVYTITLTGARKLQTYVEPGRPGFNDVHMTYLEGRDELPVENGRIEVIDASGRRITLSLRRLGPGHLVGAAELAEGVWRFELEARATDGSRLAAELRSVVKF